MKVPTVASMILRAALLASVLAACSDGDAPPAPVDATTVDRPDAADEAGLDVQIDCAAFDAGAQAGSFAEVQRFFNRRCAAGTACHGHNGQGMLDLASATLYDDLVRRPAAEFPALPRVDPGHPERSFLWMKMDGCFTELPGCADRTGPCGQQMPTLSPISEGFTLPEAAPVYAWIAAGAPR